MKALSRTAGAIPFFIAVFLNAFIDLGHKITVQNTIFKLYSDQSQIIATAILNALILLPFILLLSPAGYISDHYRRQRIIRLSAWLAFFLCGLIWLSYSQGWFALAFCATFLMAVQSAIYSPAKFAFIKELFGQQRLAEANGVIAALSIIAILAGTFAFSISFELHYEDSARTSADVLQMVSPIGALLLITALVELVMTYLLPRKTLVEISVKSPRENFDWKAMLKGKLFAEDLRPFRDQKAVQLSIVGLATFWAIGQVMLAAYPAHFKTGTGIDNTIVIQGILAASGIGIALGSFIAGRASRNRIELGLLPSAALGIAIGLFVLPSLRNPVFAALDFLFIGICGGLFIVPLNALIQFHAREGVLGKTLAANNWIQNVAMFSFLVLTVSFALLDVSSQSLLYLIALVAIVGFAYSLYQLPQSFLRLLLMVVVRNRYRVLVQGLKNLPPQGGALLLGNHISWIDWAIVQIASPRPIRFVMIRNIYERWYLKWFFDLVGCIPIEQGSRSRTALDTVREKLEGGELVCLFPEGTLSRTGHMVEFRTGFEQACEGLSEEVPILPFYLHGLWGSHFSRSTSMLKKQLPRGARRKISVSFSKPIPNTTPADKLKQKIFDLSVSSWQEDLQDVECLGRRWVGGAKTHQAKFLISDSTGAQLNAKKSLISSTALSFTLRSRVRGENIGILLPSSAAGALTNMALLQLGKTLVNLNYSTGKDAVIAAIESAEIQTLVTSSTFISRLKQKGFDLEEVLRKVEVVELEEVSRNMSWLTKLAAAAICSSLPGSVLKYLIARGVDADKTACILFSSGSEGKPKGVCLSHKNLQANVQQTLQVLNPEESDVFMGSLPLFHAFGLTVTLFLPLLGGIPVVFTADPTDALGTAKLVARFQATIMFGTSTFFRLYIRNAKVHPLMLQSLRLIVGGAERLNPQVQQAFMDKFQKPIYEGYGTTETAPVVSVNLPDQIGLEDFKVQTGTRGGSVGMPLPGTSLRIVDPDSLEPLPQGESGMVLIGGAQIMQGYLNDPDKTQSVIIEQDGERWYVTGDKGQIDKDGFLYILDRYSRFAKIGGEMISMGLVEQTLSELYAEANPDLEDNTIDLALVNLPDEKRGEKLVLMSNIEAKSLATANNFNSKGLSNLAIPSECYVVDEVPKLASGKTDFSRSKALALKLSGGETA